MLVLLASEALWHGGTRPALGTTYPSCDARRAAQSAQVAGGSNPNAGERKAITI